MNKHLGIMLVLFAAINVWGAPESRPIGFKVEKGMYQHIRAAVFSAFPGKKISEPDEKLNEITINNVSIEDEKAFVVMLRRLGHNVIDPENDGNLYRIRIMDDADKIWAIEVDSSAFKSQPKRLMELQSILGKSVSGGSGELVNIEKHRFIEARWALLSKNFDEKLMEKDGVKILVVSERKIPITIYCTNSLQNELFGVILDTYSVDHKAISDGKIVFAVYGAQLEDIRNKLRAFCGDFNEKSVGFSWVFIPAKPQKHTVTVFLDKGDEFKEQRSKVIASMNSPHAKKDFLVESVEEESVGSRCIMTFDVVSYKSKDVISNMIVKILRECNVKRNKINIE